MKTFPKEFTDHYLNKQTRQSNSKGRVDPNYTEGQPSVIYDMDIASGVLTKVNHLASYKPVANDRVLIIDGVIIGKIV